ncbi:MAG: KilA-N domain-containing protein [Elusimicrobia bacterium]|nr:KilA-N domain-containing protein [Elusimicrobiota bacterium]
MAKIDVQGKEITVITKADEDYISLTDIAKYKNNDAPADIVKNWMRNRSTVEFLGLWEKLNNPNFKLVEFDQFKSEAGANYFVLSPQKWINVTDVIKENLVPDELSKQQINNIYASEADVLNMALFGKTAKGWRDANPDKKGNIRDYADISQLVCLSNLENLNAHFINDGHSQCERLGKLNKIAIQQMKLLTEDRSIKKLKGSR